MTSKQPRAYFDHNATSPLRPEAREAMTQSIECALGNPASMHAEGRAARAVVENARRQIARLAGSAPGEVVFTSGGSEAVTAGVRGVCDRAPGKLRRIVVSAVEHSSVLEAAKAASRRGFEVVEVACDREGRVDAEAFIARLDRGTALAALQWANNETGVLQPVDEVGRACRKAGVPFLVDAVQAAGKIALGGWQAHADLVALSAHKLGGPQGVGALVVRDGIVLTPLVMGGAQERRRRGGTPSVALLAGFGVAARIAHASQRDEAKRLLRLRAKLETRVRKQFPEVRFHGQAASRLPNTVNFALPGVGGETLVIALDLAGFALSTGSACASGAVEPSHVIRAMGYDESEARGAVRISLGWSTSPEEVDQLIERLPAVVEQVRAGQRFSA